MQQLPTMPRKLPQQTWALFHLNGKGCWMPAWESKNETWKILMHSSFIGVLSKKHKHLKNEKPLTQHTSAKDAKWNFYQVQNNPPQLSFHVFGHNCVVTSISSFSLMMQVNNQSVKTEMDGYRCVVLIWLCRSTMTQAVAPLPTPVSDPSVSSCRRRARSGCTPLKLPSKVKGIYIYDIYTVYIFYQ